MNFKRQKREGRRTFFSDAIYIDAISKEGRIDRMDLVMKDVVNGAENGLKITIVREIGMPSHKPSSALWKREQHAPAIFPAIPA